MARRRQLKSCVSNLAEMLASRNFDVFGYWGMGALYKLCLDNDVNLLTFDLGCEAPAFAKDLVDPIRKTCWASLNHEQVQSGIPLEWIKEGQVTFAFNIEKPSVRFHAEWTRGDLFSISVTLRSDLEKSYSIKRYGYCLPLGKFVGNRSSRALSLT